MRSRSIIAVAVCGFVLAGCSEGTKEKLGMRRTAPDEFAVVTRAPLSVPPDYTLRPPRSGAETAHDSTVREVARQTVFGANDTGGQAQAGNDFLSKIGSADPNIRSSVDAENADGVEEGKKPVAEKLLFWKDAPEDKGVKLDPVEEKERLQKSYPTPAQ